MRPRPRPLLLRHELLLKSKRPCEDGPVRQAAPGQLDGEEDALVEDYEVVIGSEVHVELITRSKMYCGCPNEPGGPPNTLTCPTCLGLPGALPVINQEAVELTALTGRSNCQIDEFTRFDRKNYLIPTSSRVTGLRSTSTRSVRADTLT